MIQFSKWKSNDPLVVWVVVVLITQDAKRMHTLLLSTIVYLIVLHPFHLSS